MNFAWNYLFVLIWIAYLIGSGVFLFSRGFLLSRVSKTDISTCRRLSNNPDEEYYLSEEIVQEIFKDVNASSNLCLPAKSKVIILLIDALKYEFGVFKPNLSDPLPYENKLTIINDLLTSDPERSRILRFHADPPTTTLQRLKGLTTGSLPTFIDIGSNFASPEINEDNIIDQMIHNNLPVVFMGDSTWTDLYPRRFMRSYSYPSFDIFDLDTVDTKIRKHLPNELRKDDWEVLIAHFLGVDHCGHKHGPLHEEMTRKLTEMDEVIRSVIEQMDNETTLLIMGDHGMTISGDHGGDSDDETNALLFAYTKNNKFISNDYGSDNNSLQQIDLVPTLATILGIPIPYSNLGLINFNIVPDVAVPFMSRYQVLLLHAWQNAQQIYKYFYNYALENKRTFSFDDMDSMESRFLLLTHRVKTIYTEVAFKNFILDLNDHLRDILGVCRELWVKFDATQMSQGLLITFLPIFFSFLLINNSRAIDFPKIFTIKVILYAYLLNMACGVFGYQYFKKFSFKTEEHGIIFFTSIMSTLMLVFLTLKNWGSISTNWSTMKRFGNMPTRIICFILIAVFFSNSFIIQEPKIISYLLTAVILLLIYEILQQSLKVDFKTKFRIGVFLKSISFRLVLAGILAIILLRSAYSLFRCREEQGDCGDFSNNSSGFTFKQAATPKTYLIAVVVVVLYTTLTRLYLRSCGNLTGSSINVLLARYGPTIASICAGGHILLTNSAIKNIKRNHIDSMALVIYGLLLLQIIVVSVSPLMTYVLPPRSTMFSVKTSEGVVPEIFKKMKQQYNGGPANEDTEKSYEIPVVYGLATVYSSILISFGVFLAMVLIVLLEPKSSIGLVICIAVAAVVLVVHSILRYRTATSFETCIQPTFTAIVAWFLLANFCFFATSHQTTLSQIDWRAAFVGRTSYIRNSNLISGMLVILNTFCGQIFFMSMYGLLSSETFSIFALFPTLIRSNCKEKTKENDPRIPNAIKTNNEISQQSVGFDMTRGELILFENETVYLGTLFKLATQFFMLQGVKIFCAMMACTIHCRHLMVWKIFAPRFIYEGLATYVSFPAIIIGYLIIVRVHWSVDRLINRINKIK